MNQQVHLDVGGGDPGTFDSFEALALPLSSAQVRFETFRVRAWRSTVRWWQVVEEYAAS